MTTDRNAFRAGVFIIAAVAAIVAVVIGIKGWRRIVEPQQHPSVSFKLTDDVGGLNLGDDVRAGGLKVGVIRGISLTTPQPPEQPSVLIEFSIPARYKLCKDARVAVQGTLTGTTWLNINSFGVGDVQPEDVALQGYPSDMSVLLAKLGQIAPGVGDIVQNVRTVTLPRVNAAVEKAGATLTTFKQTGQTATDFITHVQGKVDPLADHASQAAANIGDFFGDTKSDFRGTLAHLNSVTGQIDQKLPGYLKRLDTVIETATATLSDIKETMVNARAISASARSIVVGNRSKFDGIVASLKGTADNLKFASAEIRRSPWRLLYKPAPGEMANLNLYDSARQFAEGATDLNDAASALHDALQNPDTDKAAVQKLLDRLDGSFEHFNEVEQKLWGAVKQ